MRLNGQIIEVKQPQDQSNSKMGDHKITMRAVRVNGQITEVNMTMVNTRMGDYLAIHYVFFQFGYD